MFRFAARSLRPTALATSTDAPTTVRVLVSRYATAAHRPLLSISNAHESIESTGWRWWSLVGAVASVAAINSANINNNNNNTTTHCESQQGGDASAQQEATMERMLAHKPPPTNKKKKQKKRSVDPTKPDPYDDLPDHDEETDCILCRTYRQGPCRAQWRKFEHCVKDHKGTSADNDADDCDAYVAPLEACWQQHPGLYKLAALDVHQANVLYFELHASDKRSWTPDMDWTAWLAFVQQQGSLEKALTDLTVWRSFDKKVPLWERFEILQTGDPTVVPVSTRVPVELQGGSLSLHAVYALDQDDMVLGFVEYDAAREAAAHAKKKRGSAAVSTTHYDLDICLLPAMTESVRILGVYCEKDGSSSDNDELKTFLYVSPAVSPQTLAKKTIKQA